MITVDTRNFNRAMRDLARLSGADLKSVVRAETVAVMEKTLAGTLAEDVGKVRARYAGKKMTPRLTAAMNEKLARRGLAKQSWLALVRAMGLELRAPAYVRDAKVHGAAFAQQIGLVEEQRGGRYMIRMTNLMQTALHADGKTALLKAINGRVGYFRSNAQKGVFKRLSTILRKYPGIRMQGD